MSNSRGFVEGEGFRRGRVVGTDEDDDIVFEGIGELEGGACKLGRRQDDGNLPSQSNSRTSSSNLPSLTDGSIGSGIVIDVMSPECAE